MIRARGCSRRARRIAWRACRSASAVTAQVLTMTAPASPASAAARRMISDSNALSRQPKVRISLPSMARSALGEEGGIEAPLEAQRRRAGHDHVAILAPADIEGAAVECPHRAALGEAQAMRGDHGGTGAAAARASEPGAALPDPQPDGSRIADRCHPDIGALRKEWVMLEYGTQPHQIDQLRILDKKSRVRVANIGADRRRQRPLRQIHAKGIHRPR